MKHLEVYLRGGGVVVVDAVNITSKWNPLEGEFTSLEWETPNGAKRKLHGVVPSEIAALVVTT